MKKNEDKLLFNGIGVSSGYAVAPVRVVPQVHIKIQKKKISDYKIEIEKKRLLLAIDSSIRDLELLTSVQGLESDIFQTQIMLLQDSTWKQQVLELFDVEKLDAESVLATFMQGVIEQTGNDKLISDLQDVVDRLVDILHGEKLSSWLEAIDEPVVLVSDVLSPSVVTNLDPNKVLGLISGVGGMTSHVSIVARSRKLPMVAGVDSALEFLVDGDQVVVDGVMGVLIIRPTSDNIESYEDKKKKFEERRDLKTASSDDKTMTKDGARVRFMANIGVPSEASAVLFNGAEGVGLFRTEHLFYEVAMPDEEQQYQAYKDVLSNVSPYPVVIRTLDAGGDKPLPGLPVPKEDNPFLGWRSIRMSLDIPDIMLRQLRALYRASTHGNLKIMFPYVSSLEEWRTIKELCREAQSQLQTRGENFDSSVPLGMMVEVPAAIFLIEEFAAEVDFLSLGTNDLIQFLLAVDRGNARVADRYNASHPALLRVIQKVVIAANKARVQLSICGEMASEKKYIPLLIGLGVKDLSLNPWAVVDAKAWVNELNYTKCELLATKCLGLDCPEKVDFELNQFLMA
ncbi:phosphoenolpyruvate--protein phosphotransferase [Fibrobacterales bacterium]|nr:phosphoenolpyruvate--protein phosphotransferase [Fibrobacterales bacterium]